jgi:hypothetical protein
MARLSLSAVECVRNFAYMCEKVGLVLTVRALGCGQMIHGVLVEGGIKSGAVSDASSIARVVVEHGSKTRGVFRGGAVPDGHVLRATRVAAHG